MSASMHKDQMDDFARRAGLLRDENDHSHCTECDTTIEDEGFARRCTVCSHTDAMILDQQIAAEAAGDGAQAAICQLALGETHETVAAEGYRLSVEDATRIASMDQRAARAECARVYVRK